MLERGMRLRASGLALAAALSTIALGPSADAQPGGCTEDAMIVFDGSGSMAEMGFNDMDEPRIFSARRAVRQAIPDIAEIRRLGLVVYGPGGSNPCNGIDVRFAPMANAAPEIVGAVAGLQPHGETALTDAVQTAADVLQGQGSPGTVVLVTDGKETCGGTPCLLAAELAATDVTVHVIGFKVRGEFFSWSDEASTEYRQAETVSRCLADRTGGLYVDTESVEELVAAFRKTLQCQLFS
ncbi:MAG: VWA domain-containing protein [Pseudomonadota bacterium]